LKIRLVLLIRSLARGGAERQLAELAVRLDPARFDVTVLTFYPGGAVWEELAQTRSIRLESVNKRGRWDVLPFAWRLARTLRQHKPTILHAYMVEPSVFGLVLGRLIGVPVIVWGVRASNVDFARYDRMTGVMFRLAALLSRFVDVMIANSDAGRIHHIEQGYAMPAAVTIPNGIDTDRFVPSAERRVTRRRAWHVSDDDVVIGLAARLDPMKGHDVFLHAAQRVLEQVSGVRFVCVGSGTPAYASSLRSLAERLSIADRVSWVAEQPRMFEIYPAFDIGCSASVYGEGFSNAIGEAMACGVPCVVSACGDSSQVVADTGEVVPSDRPNELAAAIIRMIRLGPNARARLGAAARQRIVEHYTVHAMVERTSAIYTQRAGQLSRVNAA
jgi:glycosyltransferase involved in cell wall biosynthesis